MSALFWLLICSIYDFLTLVRQFSKMSLWCALGIDLGFFLLLSTLRARSILKMQILLWWEIFLYYSFQNCLALHPTFLLYCFYKIPVIWILDSSSNFLRFFLISYFLYLRNFLNHYFVIVLLNSLQPTFFNYPERCLVFWQFLFYEVLFLLCGYNNLLLWSLCS